MLIKIQLHADSAEFNFIDIGTLKLNELLKINNTNFRTCEVPVISNLNEFFTASTHKDK